MACDAKRHAEAVELARRGLRQIHTVCDEGHDALAVLSLLGCLLRAYAGLGDSMGLAGTRRQVSGLISGLRTQEAKSDVGERGPGLLADACNIALRAFVVSGLWEAALTIVDDNAGIRHHGATWYMAAISAWAGRRDRSLALKYLKLAAHDTRMSGKGDCRNLLDDFLQEPLFAALRDDAEFRDAVRVT